MSFTVICNKCGERQKFEDKGKRYGEKIEIGLSESLGYQGSTVESIDISCNCSIGEENEISI